MVALDLSYLSDAQWFAKLEVSDHLTVDVEGKTMGKASIFIAVSSALASETYTVGNDNTACQFKLAQSLRTCVQIPRLHIKQGTVEHVCNPSAPVEGEGSDKSIIGNSHASSPGYSGDESLK